MKQAPAGIAAIMPAALATGLFVSITDIQEPSGVFNAAGAPDGSYVDVSGLTGIVSMHAPSSDLRIVSGERNAMADIVSVNESRVLLDSYYPTIQANWRAVVDGVAYDIKGVEHDSQRQMTRLRVELVSE